MRDPRTRERIAALGMQPADLNVNQGSSLLALTRLAREKGIELPICEAVHAMVFERLDPREALRQPAVSAAPAPADWPA